MQDNRDQHDQADRDPEDLWRVEPRFSEREGEVVERAETTNPEEGDDSLFAARKGCASEADPAAERAHQENHQESHQDHRPAEGAEDRALGNRRPEAYQQHHHQKPLHLLCKRVQLDVIAVLAL